MNQLYNQFNYFDNQQNQMYFFLDMFYPPHGGAHGIAWSAIMQSANNAYNISTAKKKGRYTYTMMPYTSRIPVKIGHF